MKCPTINAHTAAWGRLMLSKSGFLCQKRMNLKSPLEFLIFCNTSNYSFYVL